MNGRLVSEIQITSGVKQGDPANMIFFILGYDPILRWIAASLRIHDADLFGMCDDLSISTGNLQATWDKLLKIFRVYTSFSALALNTTKTQILYAMGDEDIAAQRDLLSCFPDLKAENISTVMKYLGVHIGRDA